MKLNRAILEKHKQKMKPALPADDLSKSGLSEEAIQMLQTSHKRLPASLEAFKSALIFVDAIQGFSITGQSQPAIDKAARAFFSKLLHREVFDFIYETELKDQLAHYLNTLKAASLPIGLTKEFISNLRCQILKSLTKIPTTIDFIHQLDLCAARSYYHALIRLADLLEFSYKAWLDTKVDPMITEDVFSEMQKTVPVLVPPLRGASLFFTANGRLVRRQGALSAEKQGRPLPSSSNLISRGSSTLNPRATLFQPPKSLQPSGLNTQETEQVMEAN